MVQLAFDRIAADVLEHLRTDPAALPTLAKFKKDTEGFLPVIITCVLSPPAAALLKWHPLIVATITT